MLFIFIFFSFVVFILLPSTTGTPGTPSTHENERRCRLLFSPPSRQNRRNASQSVQVGRKTDRAAGVRQTVSGVAQQGCATAAAMRWESVYLHSQADVDTQLRLTSKLATHTQYTHQIFTATPPQTAALAAAAAAAGGYVALKPRQSRFTSCSPCSRPPPPRRPRRRRCCRRCCRCCCPCRRWLGRSSCWPAAVPPRSP
jgi:hypothetical protein